MGIAPGCSARVADADLTEEGNGLVHGLLLAEPVADPEHLGHLPPDPVDRIEGRRGVLGDVGDQLTSRSSEPFTVEGEQIGVAEQGPAGRDVPGGWEESANGEG